MYELVRRMKQWYEVMGVKLDLAKSKMENLND